MLWAFPTSEVSRVLSAWTADPSPNQSPQLRVIRVIDGDTIKLSDGRTVRYIGIDTPELHHPKKKVECFAQAASDFNQDLVLNKPVQLELDVQPLDRYNRTLAYVYVEDQLINEILIREGYAQAVSFPPNVKYQERFKGLERSAREQQKGLWEECDSKK